ncbi:MULTISPECIES: Gx transporter family protein [Tepidanaerobacter]|uniref:Heptaprenyl diphosphate synthase n=1 Tax=Tepidanaerobacter syntrophicus TaxID=224999 RepID=A0A0U9HKS3_9FIRM|nr:MULTISPECIES: Gx transporter family protein [Tepidanaerobacter]GAQ25980.1 heptaprenyl diphosphate synthase [Tepidanaerobacter syntrophicus]GLI50403.1 hypothetical protein TSYNTROOL_04890 [Tepidanaerobacter syntrophicus]HHV83326.1 Gx transporter family protein [Tepidanaerobacter syntrophicus]
MKKSYKMVFLSLLVTIGIVLHIFENMLPLPFPIPGAKLGLANIISLLAIVLYGYKDGLVVCVLRCILGAALSGSFSSLLYSLSGGILSTIIMAGAYKYFKNIFSLVGISILGAVTHNFVQITVAAIVLSTFGLYIYLPYLMILGLIMGLFTGLAADFVRRSLPAFFY